MAKTTDRQIVNGETFMIMDAEARNNISDLKNTSDVMYAEPIEGEIVNGYVVKTATGELTSGDEYCYTKYNLSGDSRIGVSGNDYGSKWRTGCFLDSGGNVVSEIIIPNEYQTSIYIIDVPSGASKVYVNGLGNIVGKIYRLFSDKRKTNSERVDEKYGRQVAFIGESKSYPTSFGARTYSHDSFTQSTTDGYWGKKELFNPCYVESISIVRKQPVSTEINIPIGIIFCDAEYVVLHKANLEGHTETNITVPVDKFINKPFYILIRCVGMAYGVARNPEEKTKTLYAMWGTDGFTLIGDTMRSITEDSDANLVFDASVKIKALPDIVSGIDNRSVFSVVQTPRFDDGTGLLDDNVLGDQIWGSDYQYPAGYIESVSLRLQSEVDTNIAVFITDLNRRILKKAVSFTKNRTGVITVPIYYEAVEPVYLFVRCPKCYWDKSGAYYGYRQSTASLSWGEYGYKTEGEVLFEGDWPMVDQVSLFLFKLNYDNTKKGSFTSAHYRRIYSLGDAYRAWLFGEKFPICVIGDSTTDGDTTSGNTPNVVGTDHQDPNTYTSKLQELLRSALNNNVLRIYNAGFSGKNARWALKTLDDEIWNSEYYSDTKMVVISHGINDYINDYNGVRLYKNHISQIIIECFEHGVQPVMMTHQAGMENYGRFGWKQMSIADRCTKELADEFNLEIIDKNKFTSLYNVYSSVPINSIIPDSCHYGTIGHQFIAGALFACLVPTTITAGAGETIIGFANQEIKTELQYSSFGGYIWKDVKVITPQNGFKLEARCSKDSQTTLIDAWVFVNDKQVKTLKSYCTTPNVQMVSVDGTSHTISQAEQTIGQLDIGLHHIMVSSGANENVNYLGLKIV